MRRRLKPILPSDVGRQDELEEIQDIVEENSETEDDEVAYFDEETSSTQIIREIYTIDETYPISKNEKSYIFGRSACKNSAVNVQIK